MSSVDKHLIFNSFPRSGNVFMGNVASQVLIVDMLSTVHIPEIYQIDSLMNVAMFRKPEDAIASLIYKRMEYNTFFSIDQALPIATKAFTVYQKYFNSAMEYSDNIHIVNFDNLVQDAPGEVKKIVDRFNLSYVPGKENFTIDDIDFENDRLWKEKHDGHMPREKTHTRLQIEKAVSDLDFIQEANLMHEKIIRLAA